MNVIASANQSRISVEVTGAVELTLLQMFVPTQELEVTVSSQASPVLFE